MKKFFLFLSIIFLSLSVKAQPTTVYTVASIVSMKAYFGTATRVFVTETNQDYAICSPCTADEITVFAGAGGRKWKVVGSGLNYMANATHAGDSLIYVNADTIMVRRLRFLAGAGTTIDTVQTQEGVTYTINSTAEFGDAKVVPNANYTVLSTDRFLILPDPTATRTLTLPPASTMQKKVIIIHCAASSVGEWVLDGSFVQFPALGTAATITEDFINSGFGSGERVILSSAEVNGSWKWIEY